MKFAILTFAILLSTSSFAERHNLDCRGTLNYEFNTTFTYSGTIEHSGGNNYRLGYGEVGLKILAPDEGNYVWHEEFVSSKPIANNKKYNPRRYKGYAQFPSMAPIFGIADLLIPRYAFEGPTLRTSFNAIVILTYVSDHWGGSVPLNCILD